MMQNPENLALVRHLRETMPEAVAKFMAMGGNEQLLVFAYYVHTLGPRKVSKAYLQAEYAEKWVGKNTPQKLNHPAVSYFLLALADVDVIDMHVSFTMGLKRLQQLVKSDSEKIALGAVKEINRGFEKRVEEVRRKIKVYQEALEKVQQHKLAELTNEQLEASISELQRILDDRRRAQVGESGQTRETLN